MAVVRTTNEPPQTAAKNTLRRRRHQHAAVRNVWFWPSHFLLALLSHLALPVLRKEHPAGTHCCKAYAGSRAREPMYGRRIVQWTRRLPCAACMHAAEACVRAWISGHPLRKAPTVDRTAPGIVAACHGMAWPCSSYRLLLRLFPGIGVSRRGGGKVKITNSGHRGSSAPTHHPSGVVG